MMITVTLLGDESEPYTYISRSLMANAPRVPGRDLSAEQFCEFARESFGETDRQLINSFGHSKRGIHAVVDDLLHAYGLLAANKGINFPKKLQMLHEAGILALSILKNLNVERNAMEHEYRTPTRERAQEAIDVLDLLIPTSRARRLHIPYECTVGTRDVTYHALLRLDPLEGVLSLHQLTVPSGYLRDLDGLQILQFPISSTKSTALPPIVWQPNPAWKLRLKYDNRDSWLPWISSVSLLQRSHVAEREKLDDSSGDEITFYYPVSVNLNEIGVEEESAVRSFFDLLEHVHQRDNMSYEDLPPAGIPGLQDD